MTNVEKRDFGYLCRVKKSNPRQPDMSGLLEIDGVRYQLSGWVKVSKRGAKYLSLATTPLDEDGKPILPKKGKTHAGKN